MENFQDFLQKRTMNMESARKNPEIDSKYNQSGSSISFLASKREMDLKLYDLYEFIGETNNTCSKICYGQNIENLMKANKEDGVVEVYGCHNNCMKKMDTAKGLLNEYSKNHPRFMKRNENLKDIREEQKKALFYYGSKDYQNLEI